MLTTRFTDLVGCHVPIQQAPMGSFARPRLAAAVATAGGMGMVVVTGESPRIIEQRLDQALEMSPGPIGANFFMPMFDPAQARATVSAAAARARVVDFFYSTPDSALIEIVHEHGALASWQVGSRAEAVAAVEAGCDLIVAQGVEAGGHVRGKISLLALLAEVLDAVDVPVLASGGIGSGRAMAAALAAGADGVRVGTRFVAAEEAEAHPDYVEALIAAGPADTVHTETFSLGYPETPHRVLRSAAEAAQAFRGDVVGEDFSPESGEHFPIRRFEKTTVTRHATGSIQAMSLFAGESVGGVTRVQPAGDILRELAEEAEALLRRW